MSEAFWGGFEKRAATRLSKWRMANISKALGVKLRPKDLKRHPMITLHQNKEPTYTWEPHGGVKTEPNGDFLLEAANDALVAAPSSERSFVRSQLDRRNRKAVASHHYDSFAGRDWDPSANTKYDETAFRRNTKENAVLEHITERNPVYEYGYRNVNPFEHKSLWLKPDRRLPNSSMKSNRISDLLEETIKRREEAIKMQAAPNDYW